MVLEATANALAIARLLRPHVARVVLTEPSAVHAFTPQRPTRSTLGRWRGCKLSRRRQLVKQRTREKSQVHAVLMRNLKPRPPIERSVPRQRPWLACRAAAARGR